MPLLNEDPGELGNHRVGGRMGKRGKFLDVVKGEKGEEVRTQ